VRYFRHLKTIGIVVLVLLATRPFACSFVYAHDGSADARTGLSEAARLASVSPLGVGQMRSLSGWFHVIFGDAPSGSGVSAISGYVLIDDQGQATELLIDEQTLRAFGGVRAINHQAVRVTGQAALASFTGVQSALPLLAVQTLDLDGPQRTAAAVAASQAVTGPQPWATILCRFADLAAVTPHPISWFSTLMLGTTAPGLDHYWRELSFNNVNLIGSAVYGWYMLPQPRSYYVYGNPAQLDFQRAANDCTAVADADVYFPSFVGINLMFNDNLDGYAWGGSWPLTRDGVTRTYRMTWVPPWGYDNQGPIAHEMGHGFGLPHSSGPYSATYDSRWDVMSDIWDNCPPDDPTYGCVGPHTISYHKDILGWIPSAQKYIAAPGTRQTIVMERIGQPTSSTSYLMAQLPIGGSATQFYTVEVRRFVGYDAKLPGDAVVIHRVDTTRSDRDAQVVDTDGNGNPNDAGAMWLPGETFADSTNGFTIAVDAQTATGFQVTITSGTSPSPPRDFNGDAKSDLLWRQTSGALYVWLMNGTSVIGSASLGGISTDWTIEGIADFNGDGKADILWRHTSGAVVIWLMNGTSVIGTGSLGTISTDWSIAGVGDFNGDGKADVLWRHTSGLVYIWYMNGTAISGGGSPGNATSDWTIAGVGDFNGDGKSDIVWRHTSGVVYLWLMNGTAIGGGGSPGSPGTDWSIAGLGDFNGDGRADIVWRHTSGPVYIWYMSGTAIGGGGSPGTATSDWQIQ
jgi:M6 family metalloprotease-like protein